MFTVTVKLNLLICAFVFAINEEELNITRPHIVDNSFEVPDILFHLSDCVVNVCVCSRQCLLLTCVWGSGFGHHHRLGHESALQLI